MARGRQNSRRASIASMAAAGRTPPTREMVVCLREEERGIAHVGSVSLPP